MSEAAAAPLNDADHRTAVEAFRAAVAARVPAEVEVTDTDGGFVLSYREELTVNGVLSTIEASYLTSVQIDPTEVIFTMVDHGLVARTGTTPLSQSRRATQGRIYGSQGVTTYGTRADGTYGPTGTQVQDTRVLHAAVRDAAQEQGWVEKEPASALVGKTVALVAVVGLAAGGVGVAVLAVLGKLP